MLRFFVGSPNPRSSAGTCLGFPQPGLFFEMVVGFDDVSFSAFFLLGMIFHCARLAQVILFFVLLFRTSLPSLFLVFLGMRSSFPSLVGREPRCPLAFFKERRGLDFTPTQRRSFCCRKCSDKSSARHCLVNAFKTSWASCGHEVARCPLLPHTWHSCLAFPFPLAFP